MPKMIVRKIGEDVFRVSSETTEGLFYTVRCFQGIWICTCPHFVSRHLVVICKHIGRVREAIDLDEVRSNDPIGILCSELLEVADKLLDMHGKLDAMRKDISADAEACSPQGRGSVSRLRRGVTTDEWF